MDKFGYPTNIKQIGDVDDNLRIYIEDYVYTYLLQYAEAGGNEERIAALVGRCMIMDGQTVLFINGAIQGKYAESEKGIMTFSDKCFEYIDNQVDKYFKGLEVVGWLQSQPNYGNFLSASYASYHINNFKKPYQVMLVTDPIEKINSFFIWNKDRTDIEEAKGFFIYYDKNKSMHNYILDNKIVKFNKPAPMEVIEKTMTDIEEDYEEDEDTPLINRTKTSSRSNREIRFLNDTKNNKNKNRSSNLKLKDYALPVASLLFVLTIFMGGTIASSNNRINKLEGDVSNIRTAYNDLVTYINEQGTQAVFANNGQPEISSTTVVVEPAVTSSPSETQEPKTSETKQEQNVPTETITPSETPAPKSSSSIIIPSTYTVKEGDSLINITKSIYGSDEMLDSVMEENGISDPNKIYYGMVLKLPDLK